jgi:hypothetical protein
MSKQLTKILIFIVISISPYFSSFGQTQFAIERLSFNTRDYSDMSPAYYKNKIVFCSNRKSEVLVSHNDTSEIPMNLFDLYVVGMKENKKWKSPEPMLNGINTLFNEGPACFLDSGLRIIFTRNIYTVKKFGNYTKPGNNVGIFFADYYNGQWNNITPFEYNSESYNVQHPSLTEDGKIMYFASDMPGGYGGFDLYVTYLKSGKWTKPENLGPNINSDKHEAFPFIHSLGRLFFASKGWNSKGGFDLFFSQKFADKWIKPQNMKEPINSLDDDFGLIIDESLQTGFFTSSRGKSDDIYSFKSVITAFDSCRPQQKNTFCYVFFENGTSEGDVKGTMKYEWDLGDGTKIRALEAEHCYAKTGTYTIKLNVIDSLTGEIYFSQAQFEHVVDEHQQPFITCDEIVNEGALITLDAKKTYLKNFRIAKYYWDFGDDIKAVGESVNHTFFQEGVYDVKLQIESIPGRSGVRKECVYKSIVVKKP